MFFLYINGNGQTKVDSALKYAWPDSGPEKDWKVTYGHKDTVKIEDDNKMYMRDTITWHLYPVGYVIYEVYPPPEGCRCMSRHVAVECLNIYRKKFLKNFVHLTIDQ